MRKFTYNEVTSQLGLLHMTNIAYHCEVLRPPQTIGDHIAHADMALSTRTGVTIFVCLSCAARLIGDSRKQENARLAEVKGNGKHRRPRVRKAAAK